MTGGSLSNDDSVLNFRSSEQSLWKDFNLILALLDIEV